MELWLLKKFIRPEFKYVIYLLTEDGAVDKIWTFAKTEEEAKEKVKAEIEAYDSPSYQFCYDEIK